MSSPAQEVQSQRPSQASSSSSSYPLIPGGQGQSPVPANLYFPSPPISPADLTRQCEPQVPLPSGHHMFNMGMVPQYLPPTNKNMPLIHQTHAQGVPGALGCQTAAPDLKSPIAAHQMPHRVVNSNPITQYMKTSSSPAGPETPHHVINSSTSTQYVPTSTPTEARLGFYHVRTTPQFRPQSTPPNSNVNQMPSQGLSSHGQNHAQSYRHIINGHLMPPAVQFNGHKAAVLHHQTPKPVLNGGLSSQFMPPGNFVHQAHRPVAPGQPVAQPTTRYNLASSTQIDPQAVQGRIVPPPVAYKGNMPQGGSSPPTNSIPPISIPPRANVHPFPATYQPAMDTNMKRPTDGPPAQRPTKKQRKPAPVVAGQKPAAAGKPAPVSAVSADTLESAAQQLPPTTNNANQGNSSHHARVSLAQPAEPPHLPEADLAKIETSFVIEPDTKKPRPEGKTALAWDQAIEYIIEVIKNHTRKGSILRSRPLARLRELSDAIEEFIARPDRRGLLIREPEDLLNVRYIRVIEEYIALGEFDCIPDRDYEAPTPDDKEKVVREAWEKRERERPGPTLIEAQRQIFKYNIPGYGNIPAVTQRKQPEE